MLFLGSFFFLLNIFFRTRALGTRAQAEHKAHGTTYTFLVHTTFSSATPIFGPRRLSMQLRVSALSDDAAR